MPRRCLVSIAPKLSSNSQKLLKSLNHALNWYRRAAFASKNFSRHALGSLTAQTLFWKADYLECVISRVEVPCILADLVHAKSPSITSEPHPLPGLQLFLPNRPEDNNKSSRQSSATPIPLFSRVSFLTSAIRNVKCLYDTLLLRVERLLGVINIPCLVDI